jgi:putative two-component system response regulator
MSACLTHSPSSRTRTAVVVDDEEIVRGLLARWLNDAGWCVAAAENAREALAQLERHPAQVITIDVNMPELSGLWLLERVVKSFPDTAALMLTASREINTAIHSLTQGAIGYLIKPVQRSDFIAKVSDVGEQQLAATARRQRIQTLERQLERHKSATQSANEETIQRLILAATCRDEETGAHIRRVGMFSRVLALAAGWSAAQAETLNLAAPMHDVGKIGIPDAILRKAGPLTEEERQTMQQHTVIGARMLAGSNSPVLVMAEQIALCHHERWDGSGYPNGLASCAIPEAARIVAIVDVYDALSHHRIYRRALPESQVLKQLQHGANSQLDLCLVAIFFSVYEQIRAIARAHPDESLESAASSYGVASGDKRSAAGATP